jgi:hypothetical protein
MHARIKCSCLFCLFADEEEEKGLITFPPGQPLRTEEEILGRPDFLEASRSSRRSCLAWPS